MDSLSDDNLVDVLDRALLTIRSGSAVDVLEQVQSETHLDEEGVSLVRTLQELALAADLWRGSKPADKRQVTSTFYQPKRSHSSIGRYQIRRLVGSGSMGDVYEAFDPQLDRSVAVKMPRCERMVRDPEHFTERFLREARAAAAVRHPNICPIHDAGEIDGQPFVVMAFVRGETLEKLLSRGRFKDTRRAVELAVQIADALQAIHELDIIHRDLKPGNVLIDESGHAILTDFGLAVKTLESERLTSDGLIVGTPVYMSPEQAAGENSSLTFATDLFSFGAVLFEMLTGEVPFQGRMVNLLQRIKTESPRDPRELRPDLDPVLSDLVLKLMAKSPVSRYSSAGDVAGELRKWLEYQSAFERATVIVEAPTSSQAGLLQPASPQPGSPRSGLPHAGATEARTRWARVTPRSWKLAAVGVIAAGLIAAGGLGCFYLFTVANDIGESTANPSVEQELVSHAASPTSKSAISVASMGLTGEFSIIISSDPERGPVTKNRLRLEEKGVYPLRNGELVQFEARVNKPAHLYLLWVSPDGSVTPLYPWDAEHAPGFDAPLVVGGDRPTDHVLSPSSRKEGFEAGPPVGLQTFVMLARQSPLPREVDLAKLLTNLPQAPKLDTNLAATQPQLRGVVTGRTKSLEYALFDALESRLSPHFELVRMMTFPQVSE